MARWSVTYRLPKATLTDRIEVEATSPVTALSAAKLGLPDRAVIVGYRQLWQKPSPEMTGLENRSSPKRPRATLKGVLARILWPFSKW